MFKALVVKPTSTRRCLLGIFLRSDIPVNVPYLDSAKPSIMRWKEKARPIQTLEEIKKMIVWDENRLQMEIL